MAAVEIRQLRHLLALAEERSFTRAAQREHIVQSGLSSSIQGLERDVHAELYVRGSRPVRLTAAGETLVHSARRVVGEVDRGRQQVRDVMGLVEGPFSVGLVEVGSVNSSCPFVGWLADFVATHQGLEISASQPTTRDALRLVLAGELDCALVATNQPAPAGVRLVPLSEEPLVAIVANAHPWAALSSVTLAELAGERFVDAAPGRESRDVVDAAFAERGLYRRIACEVSDLTMIVELVAAGLGVALVPRSASIDPRLWPIPLADAQLAYTLQLALPIGGGLSPAAAAFADHVQSALARYPSQALPGVPVPGAPAGRLRAPGGGHRTAPMAQDATRPPVEGASGSVGTRLSPRRGSSAAASSGGRSGATGLP
jgi:DNA-binding transcriptional LysR family regulator